MISTKTDCQCVHKAINKLKYIKIEGTLKGYYPIFIVLLYDGRQCLHVITIVCNAI